MSLRAQENLILLVEDNPDDRDLALIAFKEAPVQNKVVVFEDGETALDFLLGTGHYSGRDLAVMPKLILLDIKLPRMDGLELLRRLRAHPRTQLLPVVILTSSREERDLATSYRLGANSYIRKPVDFAQFLITASQIAVYWLKLSEVPPALPT